MYGGFLLEVILVSQIKEVFARDDFCLEVMLQNGSSITLNFRNRLETLRFGMLADAEFFKKAWTDGKCIKWDNIIEISVNELFELAKKN